MKCMVKRRPRNGDWLSRYAMSLAGLPARINALMNLPSTSGAIASASMPSNPCLRQLVDIVGILQSSGDTTHPQFHAAPHLGRNVAPNHYVGNSEPASRLEHAKRFA
jgi:hypothetical protein